MQKNSWKKVFGRLIAAFCTILLSVFSLCPSTSKAETGSFPKQLPVFEVKGYYNFSEHVDELLQAFYGDAWTSLKPKEYKGLHYWLGEKKEAMIADDRFTLKIHGDISCYTSNMPGVRLSPEVQKKPGEKIVDNLPGVYTFTEAQELVDEFIARSKIPLGDYQVYYVSSEDPTMTKEKSHYYFIRFVPVFAGIPLSENRTLGLYITACITDEGLENVHMEGILQKIEEVGSVEIIDPSKIMLKDLAADNQRLADEIMNPTKETLDSLSGEKLFASDGSIYNQRITGLTPIWTLAYAMVQKDGKVLIKPVWQLSAKEFKQYEHLLYEITFDAQNGMEMPY